MILKQIYAENAFLISELFSKDFSDGWNEKVLKESFESGRFFALGVFEKEQLISVVTASVAGEDADIDAICTRSEFTRQGYAERLILSLENFLKDLKVKKIFLEVRESNIKARSLYSKCGFKQISIRKGYYGGKEDAIIMLKEI